MDKNDFDIDFDFEKEYGVDPSLLSAPDDDDFDYDQFLNEDLDDASGMPDSELPYDMNEQTQPFGGFSADDEIPQEPEKPEYEDDNLVSDFPARRERPEEAEADFGEESYSEDYEDGADEMLPEDMPEDQEFAEEFDSEGMEEEGLEEGRSRRRKKGVKLPKVKLPKLSISKLGRSGAKAEEEEAGEESGQGRRRRPAQKSAFSKLLDAYMEPVTRLNAREKEEQVLDPLDPKYVRRKRREKKRIFKEVYLPAIIAGIALCIVLSFVVGAASNWIKAGKIKNEEAKQEAQNQASAAEMAEQEFRRTVQEADRLVKGYDYDAAIQLLDDFAATTDEFKQEINEKRAELVNAQSALQEWKDTSQIANLSFHVLIADPARAFNKEVAGDLAGSYNKNFVTTEEFSRILNQLYTGNYVLVDFDSFVSNQIGVDGNESFFPTSMWLPAGKKPIMITETMVNYFEYMVDSNKDGEPDAGGHGFANKLVVNGDDIKASYIDASGNEMIGNYDLVPILEDFIKEHPDFSYRGARAILAVTGKEGVFGYRTNTSYVATKGQSYYDEQVIRAKEVVQALRDKGYTIASYTYDNAAYKGMSTVQIQAEMQNWTNQCTPILGDVKVMVFARASDIEAYSGTSFNVLYSTGFRYFLNNGTSPRVDINTTFVKQTRLMVTGESMAWFSSQFSSYFDCNMVLDMSSRGNVPKS